MSKQSGFEVYTAQLETLALEVLKANPVNTLSTAITVALDGGSSAALRRMVSIDKRRELGAFFTPSVLACEAVGFFGEDIPKSATFMDCACGAGDLLLAAARALPIDRTLSQTLTTWGQQLIGLDLQAEFIRAAKLRLLLLAIVRGCRIDIDTIPLSTNLFPLITQGNGLEGIADHTGSVTHIAINPSFSKQEVPEDCTWATEKVSSAAVFLHECVSKSEIGTKIVAILPDVLRSGSNYNNWRSEIASKATIEEVKVVGKFDTWTDVDVFLVRLTVGGPTIGPTDTRWWDTGNPKQITLGDKFEVEVGRVVPYRDPNEGPWWAYIYSKVIPQWATVRTFSKHRRFVGKVFKPPFVVVRRTSRPGDKYRAVGSVICGERKVAVENHLMVLTPKDGLVRTCRELLEVLRASETNNWLNERIRCRHLTVPALKDVPYNTENE